MHIVRQAVMGCAEVGSKELAAIQQKRRATAF
jgi:hypothetical protein